MFEPGVNPRIFGCPPGADFAQSLVDELLARNRGNPPESLARVEVYVNTRRMQRRIVRLFDQGDAVLLPKIRLVTDLANDPSVVDIPPAISPLRRRLELSQFVAALLDQQPDLAPRSAIFDLSDSLSLLLAEMQDENVTPDAVLNLDVSDYSGHWERSQKFLKIVSHFFQVGNNTEPDQQARQRRVTEHLVKQWAKNPPAHPIIVAGSTGSRGSTSRFMQAVAMLPQGAVVLPGFDFELPDTTWERLDDAMVSEDHPQFRFARFLKSCTASPDDVLPWVNQSAPPNLSRNRLVSLALRPAPITDQWMTEGPALNNVSGGARDMTLIEAPSERSESIAIALALRQAEQQGKTAALVTPDRLLTRRVTAALARWNIEPDVSAGLALDQTAPGRLLRHVSDLFANRITSENLLVLLKHPLANSSPKGRGQHLRWTRELELKLRKSGPAFPDAESLTGWANADQNTPDRGFWATWIVNTLLGKEAHERARVVDRLQIHLAITEQLAAGPDDASQNRLWESPAGAEAKRAVDELEREARYAGSLSATDYCALFHDTLKRAEVRDPVRPHPNIMIWGTLEARVQGADLVVLGGLNDGTWPGLSTPDPWLNREMRHKSGLLLPERRIGLSAHDFQQAIAAKAVILTRSVRNAEAQTIPSRWLNRLTNLMGGMSSEGELSLREMRERGRHWLSMAKSLEQAEPIAPQPRPAPMPPVNTRPKSLSVTAITKLIRDPYAIYAQHILRLKPLRPLRQTPDAPLRGTVLHKIFERFIGEADVSCDLFALKSQLLEIADEILETYAPWPAASVLWRAKLERVAEIFLRGEVLRQQRATPAGLEVLGELSIPDLNFQLTAKADRIDKTLDGQYLIYDYKTGSVPSAKQLRHFDKQLLLEAIMVENGAFEQFTPAQVTEVAHIGLGSVPKFAPVVLELSETRKIFAEFIGLVAKFKVREQGYPSRRAMTDTSYDGDYDHLARFGEWNETQEPTLLKVGK